MQKKFNSTTTKEVANNLGFTYVSTTTEQNIYPRDLKHVIIADTIEETLKLKESLQNQGYNVEEWYLTKNKYNKIWVRKEPTVIKRGFFLNKEIKNDNSIIIDWTDGKEKVEEKVRDLFYQNESRFEAEVNKYLQRHSDFSDEPENETHQFSQQAEDLAKNNLLAPVRDFLKEVPKAGKVKIQYLPGDKNRVKRFVTENSTKYRVKEDDYIIGLSIN